ncbi:999e76e0-6888-4c4b-b9a0-5791194450bf-CDS [Sclerotinia trifoliorum]|uniref:999e76e0-6888-4c4b-b9a0-5791194450bf-CDS n=1 Tax=Sclerotinia trifoliorum TaxID=28548 RepID=A0A8H2W1C6_9HELO|nr:999e76e0-6888-4c4b-b9a0-5791194450bf-CDS [Sclerotinia trifoliorum]
MGRKARATKSSIKADKPALPQTIFSLPLKEYNIPLVKHILSIFYQQSTFKKRKSQTSLLHKLAQVEQTLPKHQQEAVTQLLHHDMPITRAAIEAGPQKEDADGKLVRISKGKKLECEICLKVLPSKAFPQSVAANKCDHTTHICKRCLRQAITKSVEINPWDKIPCPFSTCRNMLEPEIVGKYIQDKLLKKYKPPQCPQPYES